MMTATHSKAVGAPPSFRVLLEIRGIAYVLGRASDGSGLLVLTKLDSGAPGGRAEAYRIDLRQPWCECPDFAYRQAGLRGLAGEPCKHLRALFALTKVLTESWQSPPPAVEETPREVVLKNSTEGDQDAA